MREVVGLRAKDPNRVRGGRMRDPLSRGLVVVVNLRAVHHTFLDESSFQHGLTTSKLYFAVRKIQAESQIDHMQAVSHLVSVPGWRCLVEAQVNVYRHCEPGPGLWDQEAR